MSALLNKGIVPARIRPNSDQFRNTYCISNGLGETNVYVKCSEKPASRNVKQNSLLWSYGFTVNQQQTIKLLVNEKKQLLFAFLCGNEKINHSKIAILEARDVMNLLDLNDKESLKAITITIRLAKNDRYYCVYSSAHDSQGHVINVKVNNFENYFPNEPMCWSD